MCEKLTSRPYPSRKGTPHTSPTGRKRITFVQRWSQQVWNGFALLQHRSYTVAQL